MKSTKKLCAVCFFTGFCFVMLKSAHYNGSVRLNCVGWRIEARNFWKGEGSQFSCFDFAD